MTSLRKPVITIKKPSVVVVENELSANTYYSDLSFALNTKLGNASSISKLDFVLLLLASSVQGLRNLVSESGFNISSALSLIATDTCTSSFSKKWVLWYPESKVENSSLVSADDFLSGLYTSSPLGNINVRYLEAIIW